jgi:signal transduction histidine kinase
MVRVTVSNEGPGISPDEVPKLFSRFARTRAAQSGGVPALGFGLYMCRGIVELPLHAPARRGGRACATEGIPRAPASRAVSG